MIALSADGLMAPDLNAQVLDLLPAAAYICNAEGVIRYYNPRAVELWGRAPRLGDHDERFCGAFRLYFPDGTPMPHAITPMAEALRTGQPQRDREAIIERPDGSRITVLVNIGPLRDPAGRLVGALNVFQDLTEPKRLFEELQRSEERLRHLIFALPAAVYTTDREGRITLYNDQAAALWDRRPEIGRDRWCGSLRIFRPDGTPLPLDQCPMAVALREGRSVRGQEILVERPDGTRVWVLPHPVPLRDGSGAIVGAVNMLVDITERKRAEQTIQKSEEELREANRRKDEFLAMLAHELRNPLAAIHSAAQVARRSDLAEEREWSQAVIERQVTHLSRLIDDLLDVSRIRQGKIQLRQEVVDASAVLTSAVETVRPLIEERKHELNVSFRPGALWLRADPVRLEQIIVNLLTNAAKYTEPGGRIWLTAEQDGPELVLQVRDTGIGIPPEVLPRMFELFAQGDCSLARSEGGLGIGLTLVKTLVEMHGGTVAASSEGVGRGSQFQVRLPAVPAPPTRRAGVPPAATVGDGKPAARILVVDDNADSARGLARLLKLLGHQIRTAHDGLEALEAARADRPDVVLLDIGLPGMDGYEVARRLRQEESCHGAVIIALSGYGQEEDRRRSRESGFDHHLVKPVDHDALLLLLSQNRQAVGEAQPPVRDRIVDSVNGRPVAD